MNFKCVYFSIFTFSLNFCNRSWLHWLSVFKMANVFLGPPQKPTNLWFSALNSNSVIIHWSSGYDGGSQQEFMVMKWLEEPNVYIQVINILRTLSTNASIGTASANSAKFRGITPQSKTTRIFFDNAGDNVTLTLNNVTLTPQNQASTITSVIAAKQTVINEVYVVVVFFQ